MFKHESKLWICYYFFDSVDDVASKSKILVERDGENDDIQMYNQKCCPASATNKGLNNHLKCYPWAGSLLVI